MSSDNSAAPEVVLKFEDVSLHFDEVTALDHVSFEMHSGATRVVLGAAGSGKTTMLKAAIGLVKPDSGHIFLLGQDVTAMTEHDLFALRSKVGVLFQEGGLFDSITVAGRMSRIRWRMGQSRPDPAVVDKKVKDALVLLSWNRRWISSRANSRAVCGGVSALPARWLRSLLWCCMIRQPRDLIPLPPTPSWR